VDALGEAKDKTGLVCFPWLTALGRKGMAIGWDRPEAGIELCSEHGIRASASKYGTAIIWAETKYSPKMFRELIAIQSLGELETIRHAGSGRKASLDAY
jgi:hypothetical protein